MESEIIGILAAVCTTFGFIPQLIRGIRTKKLDDVSPFMYIVLICGSSLWLIYGAYLNDFIIIMANVVTLIFEITILTLRCKYENTNSKA